MGFQTKVLTRLENWYKRNLTTAFKGARPYLIIAFTFVMLFGAFVAFGVSVSTQRTKIEFFPDNTPNQIIVYLEYPQGTSIEKTNAITKEIEKRVYNTINNEQYTDAGFNYLVESAVSQVGEGAGN